MVGSINSVYLSFLYSTDAFGDAVSLFLNVAALPLRFVPRFYETLLHLGKTRTSSALLSTSATFLRDVATSRQNSNKFGSALDFRNVIKGLTPFGVINRSPLM